MKTKQPQQRKAVGGRLVPHSDAPCRAGSWGSWDCAGPTEDRDSNRPLVPGWGAGFACK